MRKIATIIAAMAMATTAHANAGYDLTNTTVTYSEPKPLDPNVGYDFTNSRVDFNTPAYDSGVYGSTPQYDNSFTNSPIEPACR